MSSENTVSPSYRFATLDGLRGLAAIAVASEHAKDLFGFSPFASAHLAVDLFFVLSGFVLAHAFSARLHGRLKVSQFMRLRLIRLYPTYLLTTGASALAVAVALLAGAPLAGWTWTVFMASLLPQLAMLPAPFGPFVILYPLNGPAWSLLFELIANLAWASGFRWLRPVRLAAIALVAAACMAWSLIATGSLNGGFRWSSLEIGLVRVSYSFPTGLLLFVAWERWRRTSWLCAPGSPTWPLTAAAICLAIRPAAEPATAAYDFVAATIVLPAIIFLGAAACGPRWTALQRQLGLLSYPLYLAHVPLLLVTTKLLKILHLSLASLQPWGGVAFILVALIISWCLGRFFEMPLRAALRARARRSATG